MKIDKRIDKENTFVGKIFHMKHHELYWNNKKTFYLFKTQINKKIFNV